MSTSRAVIVGYDGSEPARDALALGVLLARAAGRRLVLACVHDDAATPSEGAASAQDARMVLAQAPAPEAAEHRVVQASAAALGLSLLAEEEDAAALVVGSGRHALRTLTGTGSVAKSLFRGSPCAVAVAPSGYATDSKQRLARIAVAFVDTDEGLAALRNAAALAHAVGAELRVVSVVQTTGEAALRAERQRQLDAAVRGSAAATRAEGVLLEGDPVQRLVELAAEGIDLLVTGSRGHGPVRQVALGSVSSGLVDGSPAPVLVLPRGAQSELVAPRLAGPFG